MGSGKISGSHRHTHSCLFTHLHSQTHSQFTCAVRPISFIYPHSSVAAESTSFVSQENSLTPLFGAREGHMTTKWWRLSAVVSRASLTLRDTGTHPWSETQGRRQNCASAVVVSALGVILAGDEGSMLLFETLSIEMGGKEGGMAICLWCIFGSGRGLAASFMMQDTGSCFCLRLDHKWVFVMLNTGTCCIVISLCTVDLLWPLFKFMALHAWLIYLPMCTCDCMFVNASMWTLSGRVIHKEEGRESRKDGLMMMT